MASPQPVTPIADALRHGYWPCSARLEHGASEHQGRMDSASHGMIQLPLKASSTIPPRATRPEQAATFALTTREGQPAG